MAVKFSIEDFGDFRRLHAQGPHTHKIAKDAEVCNACYLDLPFGSEFLQQLIEWDPHGVFHFIEGRLLNESFNETAKNAIRRFCPNLENRRVLDFGSGQGQLTSFFYECGAEEVILTEIDKKLLDLSKSYLYDLGYAEQSEFILIHEDDNLSMIEDESINVIVASEVFEHILPKLRKNILRTLYSKLSPGGIIILTAPNRLFPKDGHTTGLWFAAWFPPKIGAWYARTFASWRWKDWETDDLLRQGLRQYSYFEARKVLKPLGAKDLCIKYPLRDRNFIVPMSVKARLFDKVLRFMFRIFLKHIGPWEAWQSSLVTAWMKPHNKNN
jgi:2-polyprenyl-3-methyl-5-hydroxy-6-metoxy-1,4-benzoquinol methylase